MKSKQYDWNTAGGNKCQHVKQNHKNYHFRCNCQIQSVPLLIFFKRKIFLREQGKGEQKKGQRQMRA